MHNLPRIEPFFARQGGTCRPGWPRGSLKVASGWLRGAYRLATRWLEGGLGVASQWLSGAASRRYFCFLLSVFYFPSVAALPGRSMLDVGCWMLDVQSAWFSPSSRIPCPPVNGCRIQSALPPGSPAPAGAVVQPPGANVRLAAQTPALGRPHHFWPRRPVQGNCSEICQFSLWIKTTARQAIDQPRPHQWERGGRRAGSPGRA